MTQAKPYATGPALRGLAALYLFHYFPGLTEREFHSNVPSEEHAFQQLTGWLHKGLVAKWTSTPTYSTCGDVVGHFSTSLGLVWIGLIAPLPKDCLSWCEEQGRGIAWIPKDRGLAPKLGDLFKQSRPDAVPPVKNHVGISVAMDGGAWWTVEGGQGTPPAYDSVKMKSSNQLSNGIEGWIDLELWVDAANKNPIPEWIKGGFWKVVYQQKQTYYYYFTTNFQAAYTTDPLQVQYLPFKMSMGRFTVTSPESITLLWYETGEVERYELNPGSTDTMVGSWNGQPNELTAEKYDALDDLLTAIGPFSTQW